MTPKQLAAEVQEMIRLCTDRIVGIGAEQYHDVTTGRQKFEGMPFADLLDYADEELLDLINYTVMAHIRLRRLRAALVSGVGSDMFADASDEAFKRDGEGILTR